MRIVCLKIHLKDLCQKQIFLKNQMGAFTAVRLRSFGRTHKSQNYATWKKGDECQRLTVDFFDFAQNTKQGKCHFWYQKHS